MTNFTRALTVVWTLVVAAPCLMLARAGQAPPARSVASSRAAVTRELAGSQPAASQEVRPIAPPFWTTSVAGEEIDFPAAYRGKLVLVTVWGTWCPHCNKEIPYWKQAYQAYHRRGLEIIGLATDQNRNRTFEQVTEFLDRNQITWPQVFDDAPQIAQAYVAETLPMSYLVDGDTGEILAADLELRRKNLGKTIQRELAERLRRRVATQRAQRAAATRPK